MYFLECEIASYLRIFKVLKHESIVYQKVQNLVIKPQIQTIVKKSYEAKAGSNQTALPFEVFTDLITTEILNGYLKQTLELTTS